MTAPRTLIVVAKEPVPGRVKTRLVPPLTPVQAAAVAAAALADTLATVGAVPATDHVLALDGAGARWRPSGWRLVAQPPGGLDVRLAAAFAAASAGPAVLVGMDTPQLREGHLTAFDATRYDACLGPASDGGYWAIGLADASIARAALLGVPMSSPDTGAAQLRRLNALGLRVQLLAELTDVDTIDAAESVAALVPGSRFTAALAGTRVRA